MKMHYRASVLAPLLVLLAVGGAPLAAQALPFPQEPPSGLDNARYVNDVRRELERGLQEWVNAWEGRDATAVSRFYTDEAIVVDPAGRVVRGRPAVAGFWAEHQANSTDVVVALTHVSATNTLATARGRIAYRDLRAGASGLTRTGQMLMVFERQRGVWMTRVHAIALDSPGDMGPVETLPRAIRGTGKPARVPEVPQVRVRAEPFGGTIRFSEAFGAPHSTTLAGVGLGVEVGRVAEFRAGYWKGLEGDGSHGLRGITGEVRLFGMPDWPVRPYVMAGAGQIRGVVGTSRLGGGGGDGMIVPMAGGGLVADLPGRLAFHVDARNYLLVDPVPRTRPAAHWINEARTSNWSFSGGLSVSVGRHREWHDPAVTVSRHEYEERVLHDLAILLGRWLNGDRPGQGGGTGGGDLYAPDVHLITPDGRRLFGAAEVAQFWTGRPPVPSGSMIYEDLRASGHVATVVARLPTNGSRRPEAADATLVTVFEQAAGRWTIRSQILVERTEAAGRGP
jgi:ketosteroid isomerase-like protein